MLRALAQTIARYDMVAIQELSQLPSGEGVCGEHTMSAICSLQTYVNQAASPRTFALAVSPRIGDEQFALLYDPTVASIIDGGTYPDSESKHSRPPYAFVARVGSKSIAIAQTHTTPTQATQEIENFPNVWNWMREAFDADYDMIVGDFNADGSYFDEDSEWPSVLGRIPNASMLTGNELDTTVARSSNTYDRIVASNDLSAGGIEVFVPEENFNLTEVLTEGCEMGYVKSDVCSNVDWISIMGELSDHYPVEACFSIDGYVAAPTPGGDLVPVPTPSPPPAFGEPGDCAVVGYSADNPDDFAVLLFEPLAVGEQLFMTDNGVFLDGTLRRNEGVRSYTAPQAIAAGSILRMAEFAPVPGSGSVALSASGDQVIFFVGSIDTPAYVCALDFNDEWHDTASSASNSALPPGLIEGFSAMSMPEVDNAAYAGVLQGSKAELRSAIYTASNWVSSNSAAPDMPSEFFLPETMTTTMAPPASTTASSERRCIRISRARAQKYKAVSCQR